MIKFNQIFKVNIEKKMLNYSIFKVLLYHSKKISTNLKENFQNFSFYNFSNDIKQIKDSYKIESVKRIYYSKHKKALTIILDYKYKDLIYLAVQFLNELKIPNKIILNTYYSEVR